MAQRQKLSMRGNADAGRRLGPTLDDGRLRGADAESQWAEMGRVGTSALEAGLARPPTSARKHEED
jgi:hypothetical protein